MLATTSCVLSLSAQAYDNNHHAQARSLFESKHGVILLPVPESIGDARLRFIRDYQTKTKPMDWKAWRKQKDELTDKEFAANLKQQADTLFAEDSYTTDAFQQRMLQAFDERAAKMQVASDKQTKVRFGVIDYDKDGLMDIGEFQRTGLKSFDRYDANGDGVISTEDKALFESDQKLINKKNNRKRIQRLVRLNSQHSITGFLTRYQKNGEKLTQAAYLAHREKHFNKTDANGDGKVDPTEYMNEFNGRLGLAKSAARKRYKDYAQSVSQQADANHDGKVTKAEYLAYINKAFNAFDSNADGRLDGSDAQ